MLALLAWRGRATPALERVSTGGLLLRRSVWAAVVAVVAMLAILTWFQVGIWSDGTALWAHTMRLEPESPQACRKLGNAHLEKGDLEAAARTYRGCMGRFGEGPYLGNYGVTLFRQGFLDQAREVFQRLLVATPGDRRAQKYLDLISRIRPGDGS